MKRRRLYRFFRRSVAHPVEALAVGVAYLFFRVLPLDVASAVGGRLARLFGPGLPRSARARENLRRAFPERTDEEIRGLEREMWDNLGRTAAEFPHVPRLDVAARVDCVGLEHLDEAGRSGRAALIVTAHLGNWEIGQGVLRHHGYAPVAVARPSRNRWLEALLSRVRARAGGILVRPGLAGLRQVVRHLHAGGVVVLLEDRRLRNGVVVPFFGRPAPSDPLLVRLLQSCPAVLLPSAVRRRPGARFVVHIGKPLDLTGVDPAAALARIHGALEALIRTRPGQWIWYSRRWSA